MTHSFSKSTLKSRITIFYLLAFLPLLLIAYYFHASGHSVLGALVSFYGFLILILKKNELSLSPVAVKTQRFAAFSVMLCSFLILYVTTRFNSYFLYGTAAVFYAVYVSGVFLAFFNAATLKTFLSAAFLIVAGGFSFYFGQWLEFYMEPLVPYFVLIFVFVLRVLGIPAALHNPNTILLSTSRGAVPVLFEAGCIGIYSFLVFSIILVVTMMEESTTVRTKVLWAIGGVIGTFFVNIIRVSLIAWAIYYYGYERAGEIHSWIGYALFLLWLGFFIAVFSKRKAVQKKIQVLYNRF